MAEKIVNIRERIEQMRIKIDDEKPPIRNIQDKEVNLNDKLISDEMNNNDKKKVTNSLNINKNNGLNFPKTDVENNESFPSLSLSVKNPISSKVLVLLMVLQVMSNVGIFILLYTLLR